MTLRRSNIKEKGFTLVETMVALGIVSVVMLLVFSMMFFQMNSYSRQDQLAEAQQNARIVMDGILRDIRMAGSGIPKVPLHVGWGGDVSGAVYPITIIDGARLYDSPYTLFSLGSAAAMGNVNDSLIVIYADDSKPAADTTLQQAMNSFGDPIIVPSATTNRTDGFCTPTQPAGGTTTPFLITDPAESRADLFLVTGFQDVGSEKTRLMVDYLGGNPMHFVYNFPFWGHLNSFSAGGYPAGSRVRAVRVVRYDWAPYLSNFPITRWVNGDPARDPLAEFFGEAIRPLNATAFSTTNDTNRAFQIQYSRNDASPLATTWLDGMPADPYAIGAVRVTLWARTRKGVDNLGTTPRVRALTSDVVPRGLSSF